MDLYILDESTMHDGSAICEMLSLTLERVHRIAVETGRNFPRTVLLSSDNTVRESKNQITLMLLENLTAQYKCRVTGLLNLRKSHTHDKLDGPLAVDNEVFFYCFVCSRMNNNSLLYVRIWLDAVCFKTRLWEILARRISAADDLQTPQDVMQTMLSEMARPAMRSWVGLNTQVNAMKLDCPRSWKTHFTGPQQVNLSGGLLEDATSNHCFIFMLRRGGVVGKGSRVSSINLIV